jgi:hypothetical protein
LPPLSQTPTTLYVHTSTYNLAAVIMAEHYRTIITLKVGDKEEVPHVHQELLVDKSSVIAAHFQPLKEYKEIDESLRMAKALLQESLIVDDNEVEDVSRISLHQSCYINDTFDFLKPE